MSGIETVAAGDKTELMTAKDIPKVVAEIAERGGRPVVVLPDKPELAGVAGERLIGGVWVEVRLCGHLADNVAYVVDERCLDPPWDQAFAVWHRLWMQRMDWKAEAQAVPVVGALTAPYLTNPPR